MVIPEDQSFFIKGSHPQTSFTRRLVQDSVATGPIFPQWPAEPTSDRLTNQQSKSSAVPSGKTSLTSTKSEADCLWESASLLKRSFILDLQLNPKLFSEEAGVYTVDGRNPSRTLEKEGAYCYTFLCFFKTRMILHEKMGIRQCPSTPTRLRFPD